MAVGGWQVGSGGGHWVIRVGWEVARIQAGAANSGVPSPRYHKRSWPKRYQSAPLSLSPYWTDGVYLTYEGWGGSQRAGCLGHVPYLGNEACCTLGEQSPHPTPKQTQELGDQRVEGTQGLRYSRGCRSQTATHLPLSSRN